MEEKIQGRRCQGRRRTSCLRRETSEMFSLKQFPQKRLDQIYIYIYIARSCQKYNFWNFYKLTAHLVQSGLKFEKTKLFCFTLANQLNHGGSVSPIFKRNYP